MTTVTNENTIRFTILLNLYPETKRIRFGCSVDALQREANAIEKEMALRVKKALVEAFMGLGPVIGASNNGFMVERDGPNQEPL